MLLAASVPRCREIFLLVNNLREAVIACHHIRQQNRTCSLYVELYETVEFNEYLSQSPFNAKTCMTARYRRKRRPRTRRRRGKGGGIFEGLGRLR